MLNANSAVLNSLLTALNERVFRRGRETRSMPTLMVVGASNNLPEDQALAALFDRFLLRVRCDNVPPEHLEAVLDAGWALEVEHATGGDEPTVTIDEVRELHALLPRIDLRGVRRAYLELIQRLRHAGIAITDRRAVKLQRLTAASAILCGRTEVSISDLWVLRYVWDREEQIEVIKALVDDVVTSGDDENASHPRARDASAPDAESLARDLERIEQRLQETADQEEHRAYLEDRLGVLSTRCQWVMDEGQRSFLLERVEQVWAKLKAARDAAVEPKGAPQREQP